MAPTRGFDSKVRISGAIYTVAEWQVVEETPSQETSNTEGVPGSAIGVAAVGSESRVPGLGRCRVMLKNASFDPTANPFIGPTTVATGIFLAIRIYLNGVGSVSWNFTSVEIETVQQDSNVKGLQPITLQGLTDGNWSRPAV